MPIIDLQRRHAELGRIRLGHKASTSNGRERPAKLTEFRFTSPNERHIRDLAELYGGEPREWDNGGKREWEVFTKARSIPVIVVRGGLSQWYELWSGGGCQRRCDGRTDVISDGPCICANENGDKACKPTTRLSVMLRDLDAVGVWRLESHGWNAAVELPTNADLAAYVGDLVKANLTLHERTAIKDGKTSRFVVPGLDLEVSPARLAELAQGGAPEQIGERAPESRQIEAGQERPDYEGMTADATTVEECRGIWTQARDAEHMNENLDALIKDRVAQIKNASDEGEKHATEQVVDAELVDPEVDTLWTQVVTEAGKHQIGTKALQEAFATFAGHGVDAASVEDLTAFIEHVKAGGVAA